jgi:hypothetical protein
VIVALEITIIVTKGRLMIGYLRVIWLIEVPLAFSGYLGSATTFFSHFS